MFVSFLPNYNKTLYILDTKAMLQRYIVEPGFVKYAIVLKNNPMNIITCIRFIIVG
jgi:hypothetical protein